MSSRRSGLRVEDVLTFAVAAALLLFARSRAAVLHGSFETPGLWELSFILLPVSILVFAMSFSFAFGRTATPLGPTLGRIVGVFRDWLPFALFLLFYQSFRSRIWFAILGPDRDVDLMRIDRRMLGETPAVWMQSWITPALTSVMTAAYFLHLILPPVLAASLYRKDLLLFRRFLLAVFLSGVIGNLGYVMVPAVGPDAAFPVLFHTPLGGNLEQSVLSVIDVARAPRDVFPSLHVAVSAIVLWYAARNSRKWFCWLLPFVLANWVSTMYLRYHYFIDVIAGWACAAAAIGLGALLLRIETHFTKE